MCYPPSRNGNMPAGPVRRRCIRGEMTLIHRVPIITGMVPNTGVDFKQTRDVGQYAANPWGFFDMHGNVWEWTADWYQAAYPTGNPVVDPTGPASGSYRVTRGGSWTHDGTYLRSAKRTTHPQHPSRHLGFRVGFQQQ